MSDLNAAATLSMKIDTARAAEQLHALRKSYNELKQDLASGFQAVNGVRALDEQVRNANKSLKEAEGTTARQAIQIKRLSEQVMILTDSLKAAKAGTGGLSVAYTAAFEGGRVGAKKALQGMTTDQVIELAKQQANLQQYRQTLLKHYEMVSRDARASAAAMKSQIEALTASPVGMAEMRAYYKAIEDEQKQLIESAVANLKAQEQADAASSAARLKAATAAITSRQKVEQDYTSWWIAETKKRERAEQDAIIGAVKVLKQQETAEKESSAARLKAATAAIASRQKVEQDYTSWWIAETKKREQAEQDAIIGAVKVLKQQEAAEKESSAARLKAATEAIAQRKRVEQDYTSWWESELRKRAAAELRAAEQRSRMQTMSAERLERMLGIQNAPSAQSQYYRNLGLQPNDPNPAITAAAPASVGQSYQVLAKNTESAASAQTNWNKVANEGHALARGLSGALGTLWITYGSLVPLLTGAAIGAVAKNTITMGAEFERQMTFVRALGGETLTTTEAISNKILEIGRNSMFGPAEMASGMRLLAQAGLTASEAIQALPNVLNLATVGEMDMEMATKGLVGTLNTFNIEVSKSSRVTDVLAKAAAESQTDVKGITEGMKYASAASTRFNLDLEETATYLTLFAKSNLTGSMSGTAFANMLKEIYTPTTDKAKNAMKDLQIEVYRNGRRVPLADILEQLRVKFENLNEASRDALSETLTNERGARGLAAIFRSSREEIDALTQRLREAVGFGKKVSDEIQADTKGGFDVLANALKTALTKAYESVRPEVQKITKSLVDMVNSPEFASGVSALIKSVVSLTEFIIEHGKQIVSVLAIYAGFKALSAVAVVLEGIAIAWVGLNAAGAVTLLNAPRAAAAVAALSNPFVILGTAITAVVLAWQELNKLTGSTEKGLTAQINKLKAEEANLTSRVQMGGDSKALQDRLKSVRDSRASLEGELDKLKGSAERREHDKQAEANRKALAGFDDNPVIPKKPEKPMGSGPDTWTPGGGKPFGGGGKLGKDWDYEAEKAAIARVKDQQANEIAILESSRSNKLIGEERYREDLAAIHVKYDFAMDYLYEAGLKRLKGIVDAANGDEKKRAQAHHDQLLGDKQKYTDARLLRLKQSADRELGIIKESQLKVNAVIAKAQADADAIMAKANSDKLKRNMNPEQVAAYDAGVAFNDRYRQEIVNVQNEIARMEQDKVSETNAEYVKQKQLLDQLVTGLDAKRNAVMANAAAAAQEARSFEAGWKTAYRRHIDEAGNSAKMAESMFNMSVNSMENALTEFIETGTVDWRKMVNSMLMEMIKLQARWLMAKTMDPEGVTSTGMLESMMNMFGVKTREPAAPGSNVKTGMPAATDAASVFSVSLQTSREQLAQLDVVVRNLQASMGSLAPAGQAATGSLNNVSTSGSGASTALQSTADTAESAASYLYRMATSPMMGVAAGAAGGTGGSGLWGMAAGMIANYFVPGSGAMVSGLVNAGVGAYNGNTAQALQGLAGAYAGYNSYVNNPAIEGSNTFVGPLRPNALGNAFGVDGLHAFAKGEAFSNQILTSPTFFKFANGGQFSLGVAGEAGEEAVMPLQRDSQGRLGVIAAKQEAAGRATEAPPAPQTNLRIVNAFDTGVISDYMGSSDGEKVIMNAVKKNQATIKRMTQV